MKLDSEYIRRLIVLLMLLLVSTTVVWISISSTRTESGEDHSGTVYALEGWDGPYIYFRGDSLEVIRVKKNNGRFIIRQETASAAGSPSFEVRVDNASQDSFSFELQPPSLPPATRYPAPEKLLAISDIEGNFNAFASLLRGNEVIDDAFNWAFGDGHLVLLGDFVDRGENVMQCLWLAYKLEKQAREAGGQVHFILGNHEFLNFQGMTQYVHRKYIELAHQISKTNTYNRAFAELFSPDMALMEWLHSKNVVEKIGDVIFVHGGLSGKLLDHRLELEEINHIARRAIRHGNEQNDSHTAFVMGREGPLWYRGLVSRGRYYDKASIEDVNRVLDYYGARSVAIGHTIVPRISTDYQRRVIRLDIKQPRQKNSGKAQALLIENGQHYRVNDKGERVRV